jgi:glycosyltransferase involved in cell wall biosynthesis
MKPKLSIVMPAKNVERFLSDTLDSILKQRFQNWELVFVDDHSTDHTGKLIKQCKDVRVKYHFLEEGTGVAAGRNYGCQKALADIIVTADSDDINYPERLSEISNFFNNNPTTNVVYSNVDFFYTENGEKITRPFQPFEAEVLKNVNFIANSSTAFSKKSFLHIGGYDVSLKMCEDYDLWLSFMEQDYSFGYIDKPLVQINRYPGSTTGTRKDLLKQFIHQVKRKHELAEVADIHFLKKTVAPDVYEYFTTPGGKFLWFEN